MAVLVHAMGAFFPLLAPGPGGESQPLVLLVWVAAYAFAVAGLLDGLLRERRPLTLPAPLLAFVGLALLSASWSIDAGVTLRRSVALVGTVAVGVFLAQHLSPLDVLQAVRRAAVIVAGASLLLYAVGDPRAIDDLHQTLQGVLATKNSLGRVMAVGILAAALETHLDRGRWRMTALSLVPMVTALALTESATGMVVTVAGLLLISLAAAGSSRRGLSAVGAVTALVAALVAVFALTGGFSTDDVTGVAGRDATLTGRTGIWAEVVQSIAQRPALGYGYGAFWDAYVSGGHASEDIRRRLDDTVANAHNGWLEIALALGLLGVLTAAAVVVSDAARAWSDVRAGRRALGQFRFFALLLALAATTAESGLLQENNVLTVLLVCGSCVRPSATAGRSTWPDVRRSRRRVAADA